MKIKKKYLKWINKNIKIESGITIAITGPTSGIGKALAYYLSSFDVNLILIGRNKDKLNQLNSFLQGKSNNEFFHADLNLKDDAIKLINFLKNKNIDVFYNNAGIYHQNIEIKDGFDKTFKIDYLVPIILCKELSKINRNIRIINTSSISYHYHKFLIDDIQGLAIKSKIKRYGYIKRLLMIESTYLRLKDYHIYLAHPGIACTGLFSKENKAYNKLFYIFIVPIMKLIFMDSYKASLSLLFLSNNIDIKPFYQIGPGGLFHSFSYPKIQQIKKLANENEMKILDEKTDEYIKEFIK